MSFDIQIDLAKHQQEALVSIVEELQNENNRVLFSMCTGSGKTRVILKIPHEMNWEKTIYIFPTLSLVDQFKHDYIIKYNIPNVIFVCSLKETKTEHILDYHEYITDNHELIRKINIDSYTVITTYASLEKVLKCVKKNKQSCNLIFDEAHHEKGENCQKILDQYNEIIDNQVLASATFDETEKDELCYNYTYSDAVDDGICRDFDIYVNLRKKGQERDMIKDLKEIQKKTGNSKCMVFTQYSNENEIENKNNVEQFFNKYKKIVENNNGWIQKITAKTKQNDRLKILKEFDTNSNNNLSLLVSCKTIGEGVDTKNANMVLFVDSTKSIKDIIQKIGRAVRIYRDENGSIKKEQPPGSIIIFVYVDDEKYKNCSNKDECDKIIRESMYNNGDFSTIFNVMVALKQNDEEMYKRCIYYPYLPDIEKNTEKSDINIENKSVIDISDDCSDDVINNDDSNDNNLIHNFNISDNQLVINDDFDESNNKNNECDIIDTNFSEIDKKNIEKNKKSK